MAHRKSSITTITDWFFDRMRHRDAWQSESNSPTTGFSGLAGGKYALLATYKRSGEGVPSPIWFGLHNGNVYFWTEVASAKVRRIRHNQSVLLAPCRYNGQPTGRPAPGTARLLGGSEAKEAERIVAANYRAGFRLYRTAGKAASVPTVFIEITPQTED